MNHLSKLPRGAASTELFTSKCDRDKAQLHVHRVAEKSFPAGVVAPLFLI
jgi:hypothetical protein